jgi:hypothetical protein
MYVKLNRPGIQWIRFNRVLLVPIQYETSEPETIEPFDDVDRDSSSDGAITPQPKQRMTRNNPSRSWRDTDELGYCFPWNLLEESQSLDQCQAQSWVWICDASQWRDVGAESTLLLEGSEEGEDEGTRCTV